MTRDEPPTKKKKETSNRRLLGVSGPITGRACLGWGEQQERWFSKLERVAIVERGIEDKSRDLWAEVGQLEAKYGARTKTTEQETRLEYVMNCAIKRVTDKSVSKPFQLCMCAYLGNIKSMKKQLVLCSCGRWGQGRASKLESG